MLQHVERLLNSHNAQIVATVLAGIMAGAILTPCRDVAAIEALIDDRAAALTALAAPGSMRDQTDKFE